MDWYKRKASLGAEEPDRCKPCPLTVRLTDQRRHPNNDYLYQLLVIGLRHELQMDQMREDLKPQRIAPHPPLHSKEGQP